MNRTDAGDNMYRMPAKPIGQTLTLVVRWLQSFLALIFLLFWLTWGFGFGVFPYSLLLSSAILGLPLAATVIAAVGMWKQRPWGRAVSLSTDLILLWVGAALLVQVPGPLTAQGLFALIPLVSSVLLLLPVTRRDGAQNE